jgi:CubicO group peptidase (beta-lactamase class C family)
MKPVSKMTSEERERMTARARHMLKAGFVFNPSVFFDVDNNEFPGCDFLDLAVARQMLGDYKIETTFYRWDYEVVEKPTGPGRYGAIVRITAEDGQTYTRFRTLYKTAERVYFDFLDPLDGELMFPADAGVDALTWQHQRQSVNQYIGIAIGRDVQRSHDFAVLLAGLNEIRPEQAAVSQLESAVTRDRQWWLELKRKLNGNVERFTKPRLTPVVVDGLNAPVLRRGTEKEAGMKAGSADRIHDVLLEWVSNSDEPFNVCIARNAVVFLDRGYGERDGQPVSSDTRHLVFSITKALSGCLLMMFVDRGIIKLEDPVGKILTEFDDRDVEAAVTFYHLFTHTADMDEHLTDTWNDLEHVYGEAYPYLRIGKQHRYNGTSIAIGLKALEQLTGLTLPHLYQDCLFGPLGCESIESIDGSALTWSNAYDLLRVGQMMANRGAYGNLRFFTPETFQQMLPRKLDKLLGTDTDIRQGIGLTPFVEHGLSSQTIGHGSASSCTLRIDLGNDLVIAMTRRTAGQNFEEYHAKFMAAVASGLR